MQRRDFLVTAGAVGLAATTLKTTQAAQGRVRKQFIELKTYTVADEAKKEQLIAILDKALIPALNRQRIKPVGVFWTNKEINEGKDEFDKTVFVVVPHATENSFIGCTAKLLADKQYMKDAAPIFEAPMKDPLYQTYESTLMLGFEKCPQVEVPTLSPDRVAQLRYYKSYNLERNAAKIHMFDQGGELPLFRKVKMNPIFFGETIFGTFMPNLTYMLSFENEEARKLGWKMFIESDEWAKIKSDPLYKDTANTIVNVLLKPSPGSQI